MLASFNYKPAYPSKPHPEFSLNTSLPAREFSRNDKEGLLHLPLGSNDSQLTNSYYVGSRHALPQQQIGVVRYSINPYSNHSVAAPPPHFESQGRVMANRSASLGHSQPPPSLLSNNSALTSNHSATSIMHQPRPIQPLKKAPFVQSVGPMQPFQSITRPSQQHSVMHMG